MDNLIIEVAKTYLIDHKLSSIGIAAGEIKDKLTGSTPIQKNVTVN